MFHIALFKHCESAEDETGRLHLDLHDPGQAEAGKTLLSLVRDKAHHGSGEGQGAIFPPLLTVDVIGTGPAVDGDVPAHYARRQTDSPARGNELQYYICTKHIMHTVQLYSYTITS